MKIKTKKTYYERRTQNVQKIEKAILLLELRIKDCIIDFGNCSDESGKQKIESEIELYTNLLSGAVIIWCESLIKALFYEHGAFEEEQINELLSKDKSLEQKWALALTCAFFKAFSGQAYNPTSPITNKSMVLNLGSIAQCEKDKFTILYDLIETRLVPAIKIRNKIQHGDWVFAFNEAKFEKVSGLRNLTQKPIFDRKSTPKIQQENMLTLRLKRNQFRVIYGLTKDLAVFKRYGQFRGDNSSTPFQHNFAKRYNQILSNQGLIDTSSFEKYRNDLVLSKQRGKKWKRKNKNIFIKIKNWITDIFKRIVKI